MSFKKYLLIVLGFAMWAHCDSHDHGDHHHQHEGNHVHGHDHDHAEDLDTHKHDHHQHDHDHEHNAEHEPVGPPQQTQCSDSEQQHWSELFIPSSKREAFWNGILSTTFIGCAPILCVKFVSTDDAYLKILLSFAAGGLMGDVFLHLLPTALSIYDIRSQHLEHAHEHEHEHVDQHEHEHEHSHSHNQAHSALGMHILIGFVIFFILEKLFHEIGATDSHSHAHSDTTNSQATKHVAHDDHDAEARKYAVTVLSVCADASHNFTDGLTIAASFLFSFRMGLIQTFSILLHEIPHEIGDYAILIENGVSISNAMGIQFLTAIACLLGTIVGFLLEENEQIGTQWIIPFTAGGFIYISCVQVLPTLVERKYGKLQSLGHVVFFGLGIAMMVFVSYVEENAEHWM